MLCIGLDIPVVAGSLVVEGQDERSHMGYHRRRQLLQRISICRVKRVCGILTSNVLCTALFGKMEKGCCRHFVGIMPVVVLRESL